MLIDIARSFLVVDQAVPIADPHSAMTIRAQVVRLDEKSVGDAETLVFVKRPFHRRWTMAWVGRRDVPGLAVVESA